MHRNAFGRRALPGPTGKLKCSPIFVVAAKDEGTERGNIGGKNAKRREREKREEKRKRREVGAI